MLPASLDLGLINRKLYSYLQRARIARNELIHKGSKPSQGDSYFSLVALAHLLEIICTRRSVGFEAKSLLRGLGRRTRRQPTQGIMRAENVVWSNVGYWRPVKPIPGESSWTGEYEKRLGIELVRVNR